MSLMPEKRRCVGLIALFRLPNCGLNPHKLHDEAVIEFFRTFGIGDLDGLFVFAPAGVEREWDGLSRAGSGSDTAAGCGESGLHAFAVAVGRTFDLCGLGHSD